MTLLKSTSSVLKKGDKGPHITLLQKRLRRQDFDLKIDGIFGPATHLAVKLYQSGQRLKADGIVGPVTETQFYETG